MKKNIPFLIIVLFLVSCNTKYEPGTFGHDVELLKVVDDFKILKCGKSHIAVIGKMQGRVLTSSSGGMNGTSYGWFNRNLFDSSKYVNKYSAVAGEGRLFFGPEAGKYSLFFNPDSAQGHGNVTREAFDTLSFELISESEKSVTYGNKFRIINYNRFEFIFNVERTISVLEVDEIEKTLQIDMPEEISHVAFNIFTEIENTSNNDWKKETGLISIWDLCTLKPGKSSVAIIPVRNKIDSVNPYFTQIDSSRAKIIDNVVYYKSDADYLNKIGIPAVNTKPVFGSYTPEMNLLTIVKFSFSDDSLYVNSNWEQPDPPYKGDVINVFNDGVINGEGPWGPFYELESSSSAKELKISETHNHSHTVYHFEGDKMELNKIALKVLGVDLNFAETVFH